MYKEKDHFFSGLGRVVSTAEKLETKGSISQVKDNKAIIDKIQTEEFWEEASLFDYEIVGVKDWEAIYNVNDLGN